MKALLSFIFMIIWGGALAVSAADFFVSTNGTHLSPFSSWATAATNIQSAVDVAVESDTVWVTNGLYAAGSSNAVGLATRVVLNKEVTVQSVNGPTVTSIVGEGPLGASAVRCAYLIKDAVLSGFTLTNGFTKTGEGEASRGGGLYLDGGGAVSNCVISGCSADYDGGGAFFNTGGSVVRSTFSNNTANWYGGAAYINQGGELQDCTLSENWAGNDGGGLYFYKGGTVFRSRLDYNAVGDDGGGVYFKEGGSLFDSLLIGNSATNHSLATGGGVFFDQGGTLEGSTVVGNIASYDGCGVFFNQTGTVQNSILWGNAARVNYNYDLLTDTNFTGSVSSSCTWPAVPGNRSEDPLFLDAAMDRVQLEFGSPCIGAGENGGVAGLTDFYGHSRISGVSVDIGAHEYLAEPQPRSGPSGGGNRVVITNAVTALGSGTDITNVLVNGTAATILDQGTNWVSVLMPASSLGYADFLIQSTSLGEFWLFDAYQVDGSVIYADAVNGCDAFDGLQWTTAKQTLQAAVDAVDSGGTVWATNGTYNSGGKAASGSVLMNRVMMAKPITLCSVNGPSVTAIEGAAAVRGLFMTNGCALVGFTVTNGHAQASTTSSFLEESGGGIWMGAGCSVSNCFIRGNSAHKFGGGVYLHKGGTLQLCEISENRAGYFGGGLYMNAGGTVNNSCLYANNATGYGGGVECSGGGTLNNVTVSGNTAGQSGGGVEFFEGGTLNNSIVWGNSGGDLFGLENYGVAHHVCAFNGVTNEVDGCSTSDPLFVDLEGYDFHLQGGSPCINGGSNALVVGSIDLDGYHRIIESAVDMGAYEMLETQTISTFLPIDSRVFLTTDQPVLTAEASSGLPIVFAVGSGHAVITDGTNLTFSAAGTVEVEASQSGDDSWKAAVAITNTYTIAKANATVTLSNLSYTYDGSGHEASVGTDSFVETVDVTYDGVINVPVNAGTYTVVATINDTIYQGTATNSLVISKASASVSLDNLEYIYDGAAHAATVTTDPEGLIADLTYNGGTELPVAVGTYEVIATVNDANYQGATINDLVVSRDTPVLSNLTASEITYGQNLQQVLLSGNSGGIAGEFAFASPSQMPDAGTASHDVIFTPTDTASYSRVTGSVSVTVQQRSLSVTGISASDKTYDGTTEATLAGGTLVNGVGEDDVTLVNLVGQFSQATVGVDLSVGSSLQLAGTDADNYVLQQPSGLSATLSVKELTTGSPSADNKIYDGTTVATISGVSLTGGVSGDDVSLTDESVGAFAQSNAGEGISVTSSMSLSGNDKDNYTLTVPAALTADITKATQTISDFLPIDGTNLLVTTTHELSATASSGLPITFAIISSDDAAISDGTNLTFSGAGTVWVEASQSGNTNWNAAASVTNTYTVDKIGAIVTLSDLTVIYDGTSQSATVVTDPVGLIVDVTYNGSVDLPVNAGTYEVLATIDDAVYEGNSTANLLILKADASVTLSNLAYTYNGNTHEATATTDPEGLTVALTYDGSTTFPVSVGTYQVIATIDELDYKGAATNELVIAKTTPTLSNLSAIAITYGQLLQHATLSGESGGVAGNFMVASPAEMPVAGTADHDVIFTPTDTASYNSVTGTVFVTVQQRSVSVTGVRVTSKTYDGTTVAVLAGGTLGNVVDGDEVSLTHQAGLFSQAEVGVDLVVVSSLRLTGVDAGNYSIQQPSGLSGSILAKELTGGSAVAQNKTYDGNTVAVICGASLIGVIGDDDVSLTDATVGVFAQSAVGTGIAVASSMILAGDDKDSYTLTLPSGLTANITKATQTLSDFLPANGARLVVTETNTLSATASSGLPVSFSVVSGSAAIAGDNSLTFSGVGEMLVEATQAGDDNWDVVFVTNTYTVIHNSPIVGLTSITRSPCDETHKISDLKILANISDPEGSDLTLTLNGSTSTNGGTVVQSGHYILFTPKAGSDATDRFEIRVTNAFGNETLGWVEIRVEVSEVYAQATLNLQVGGGNNTLTFFGIPNWVYTVQISTNLEQGIGWQDLRDVAANAMGRIIIVHTNAPSPAGYYRMVE